jgi:hypothetical protein
MTQSAERPGYGLHNKGIVFRFPAKVSDFFSPSDLPASPVSHSVVYSNGNRIAFSEVTTNGARLRQMPTSLVHLLKRKKMSETTLRFLHTPS